MFCHKNNSLQCVTPPNNEGLAQAFLPANCAKDAENESAYESYSVVKKMNSKNFVFARSFADALEMRMKSTNLLPPSSLWPATR
jgi:hypothetical protein